MRVNVSGDAGWDAPITYVLGNSALRFNAK